MCVNVDLVGGISADASGLRSLSRRIEGIISTHRHRLFAIDSGAVGRGLELIRRADPHCVEILPALALPKSEESVAAVLAAGAAGVSPSHRGL